MPGVSSCKDIHIGSSDLNKNAVFYMIQYDLIKNTVTYQLVRS